VGLHCSRRVGVLLGSWAITGASLPLCSWIPWQEVETSQGKHQWWGWGSPTLSGHLFWHAPSGPDPLALSGGAKFTEVRDHHISHGDRRNGGGVQALGSGWAGVTVSSPSIQGGQQEPDSPGHSPPARTHPCGAGRKSELWLRPLLALPHG
jgi:hypothetical protein